ncbi:MAG: hypothetical protein NFCOHLIN_01367 [Gammaproteobacteria bacterium]|nr:hypothetical protein [Gammaproteobacteria bacterium]
MRLVIAIAATTMLAALAVGMPAAEDRPEREHDRAMRLVRQGRVLPLEEIVARASKDAPGQLIEAELDEENGRYVYELEVADRATGRVTELRYDARSGELLATEIDD